MWRTMYFYCIADLPFSIFFIEFTPVWSRTVDREQAGNTANQELKSSKFKSNLLSKISREFIDFLNT